MKLNWGHYIIITFALFVLLIGFLVVRSFMHKNDLVAEDYYNQELNYQETIDQQKRANDLNEKITWVSNQQGLVISYPKLEKNIQGKITLFRPSDEKLDLEIPIQINETGQQSIPSHKLTEGKYLIKITWSTSNTTYFTEGSFFLRK